MAEEDNATGTADRQPEGQALPQQQNGSGAEQQTPAAGPSSRPVKRYRRDDLDKEENLLMSEDGDDEDGDNK